MSWGRRVLLKTIALGVVQDRRMIKILRGVSWSVHMRKFNIAIKPNVLYIAD